MRGQINAKAIALNCASSYILNKTVVGVEVQGRSRECGARYRQGGMGMTQRSREGKRERGERKRRGEQQGEGGRPHNSYQEWRGVTDGLSAATHPRGVTGRTSINQFSLTVQPATRSSPKRWPEQDTRYGQLNEQPLGVRGKKRKRKPVMFVPDRRCRWNRKGRKRQHRYMSG